MKKTLICLLAVVLLAAVLAACSAAQPEAPAAPDASETAVTPDTAETAETPEPDETPEPTDTPEPPASDALIELKAAGVGFDLPEEMRRLNGVIQAKYGMEVEQGSGIYLSGLTYCAMSQEKYRELMEKGGDLTDEERAFSATRMVDFLLVYTVDGAMPLEELAAALERYGLPTQGCREIGAAGDYRFYAVVNPFGDRVSGQLQVDEDFRGEYDTLIRLCDDTSWIRCSEPQRAATAGEGTLVAFETTDLYGNPVSSRDLFSAHTLTMVNLWGTYCGPCINEMPDLEELNGRLREKNCAIVGVVIDVPSPDDAKMVQAAEEIIADTGVTYQNLLPWSGISESLPSEFIPTTYFIDANGKIVGEAVVGANGADDYEAVIDALLEKMV